MPYSRNPNDPYRANDPELTPRHDDPHRVGMPDSYEDIENDNTAGSGRIALYAVAVIVVLGAVFYGVNSSMTTAPTSTTQTETPGVTVGSSPSATAPDIRNVTPAPKNAQPGGTTTEASPYGQSQPAPMMAPAPNSGQPAPTE